MARVLALQPWDAGSHASVRASIQRHGALEWRFEAMPGHGPRWRLRHAGLAFGQRLREAPVGDVDAVFATSMMSLADLRATEPPSLRTKPHILYMHENQAAYPASPNASPSDRTRDAHLLFTNLASIEAADRVIWNSDWNRESFVAGMEAVLSHAPEPVATGWIDRLVRKSVVIPPPVEPVVDGGTGVLHNGTGGGYPEPGPVTVAWPHRWEFDKGCDDLLAIADRAWTVEREGGPRLRWCLLGAQGPRVPEAMKTLCDRHGERIVHRGWIEDPGTYRATLGQCDWVLSTSRHEFFGIAVAEALLEGCLPWLPKRLSYPELVPEEAFGLDPWMMPEPRLRSAEEHSRVDRVRAGTADRLEPALAPRSVASLESEVRTAIERSGSPGGRKNH